METTSVVGVVEDCDDDFEFVRRVASAAGWAVRRYRDLAAGYEAVCADAADLFLVDWDLPDGSGLDLIRRARARRCQARLVVLTAADDPAIDREALSAGADDYLDKTELSPSMLRRAMRYGLRAHETLCELDEARRRLQLAVEGARDGIWDIDLRNFTAYLSPRCAAMLEVRAEGTPVHVRAIWDRVVAEDQPALLAAVQAHLGGQTEVFSHEFRVGLPGGGVRWLHVRGSVHRRADGVPVRFAGSQTDTSERKRVEQAVKRDAQFDDLTGLGNRRLLAEEVARALEAQAQHRTDGFALIYLDLDGFKPVNDRHGHATGDRLLTLVARRLERVVRSDDVVTRVGGDEFVILIRDCADMSDIRPVVAKIRRLIAAPYVINGARVDISTSVGVALASEGATDIDQLTREADARMYADKRRGKAGETTDLDSGGDPTRRASREREARLAHALREGRFRCHVQPIVQLDDGGAVGWEAFPRWQTGVTCVPARAFVGEVARAGLSGDLRRAVLGRALEFIEARPVDEWVTLNVHVAELADSAIVAEIEQALEERSLPTSRLCLEVVDHAQLREDAAARSSLESLSELGVRLSLDGFGGQGCSPSMLAGLGVGSVKLCARLVAAVDVPGEGPRLVHSLVAMAQALGCTVVAGGVERSTQPSRLRVAGVSLAQGHLFGPPELPGMALSRSTSTTSGLAA